MPRTFYKLRLEQYGEKFPITDRLECRQNQRTTKRKQRARKTRVRSGERNYKIGLEANQLCKPQR